MSAGVQIDVPDRFVEAVIRIRNVLGPESAGCGDCCEGCRAEMHEALRLANEALGFPQAAFTGEDPQADREKV